MEGRRPYICIKNRDRHYYRQYNDSGYKDSAKKYYNIINKFKKRFVDQLPLH